MADEALEVARHYDRHVAAEAARLERFAPVEYAITRRYLARFLGDGITVADAGVGAGHYAQFLARRGCRVHLIDVSANLLRAAQERLAAAGLGSHILSVDQVSATALPLADESVDAILLLGPLYHLRALAERQSVVREAARVLKPGGTVAAAGVNRIAFLRDMFRASDPYSSTFWGEEIKQAAGNFPNELRKPGFLAQYLATGSLDPQHAPPIGYAHLTTVSEFRELLTAQFQELALIGTESFTAPWQDVFLSKPSEEAARWLDIVEATGRTAEGLAYSDHFLFIGRK
jgi:ubiquinone/menaquinone biosynthesis C-methylase UbiE